MTTDTKVYLSWNDSFQKVKSYVEQYNKFPVSSDKPNGGHWIHMQRQYHKRDILSGQQLALLRTLPPWKIWEANPWKLKFKRVKAYFASNCNQSLYPTDFSFSDWWNDCKKDFKNDNLEEDRLLLLRTIPEWVEWEQKNLDKTKIQFVPWIDSYNQIKQYVDEHHNFPYSRWIDTQKYRFKCNKLQPDQIQLLQQLPPWINWVSTPQAQVRKVRRTWDDHYIELLGYIKNNGKLPLKKEKTSISYWVLDLKTDYRNNHLSPEQLQKLQELSVWNKWVDQFNKKKQAKLLKSKQI
jgi:hypothetical protein